MDLRLILLVRYCIFRKCSLQTKCVNFISDFFLQICLSIFATVSSFPSNIDTNQIFAEHEFAVESSSIVNDSIEQVDEAVKPDQIEEKESSSTISSVVPETQTTVEVEEKDGEKETTSSTPISEVEYEYKVIYVPYRTPVPEQPSCGCSSMSQFNPNVAMPYNPMSIPQYISPELIGGLPSGFNGAMTSLAGGMTSLTGLNDLSGGLNGLTEGLAGLSAASGLTSDLSSGLTNAPASVLSSALLGGSTTSLDSGLSNGLTINNPTSSDMQITVPAPITMQMLMSSILNGRSYVLPSSTVSPTN